MTTASEKKVLILGGTQFIGRQAVLSLLAAGHKVTVFNRGTSVDDLPTEVERLRGDRNLGAAGLAALSGRRWDACIDVSGYTPRQVRPTAELLSGKVDQYVYISSGAVYADQQPRPVVETHDRLPPAAEDVTEINGETYGPLKIACEDIVQEFFPGRCTILRPQIVVGPHDTQRRYSYWVQRAMLGGPLLAPGDGSDYLQVIDVRDVAKFLATVVTNNVTGTFNLSGPRIMWAEFIRALGVKEPVWVSTDRIRSAGITESELPLFRTEREPQSSKMDVSNRRAVAAGLVLTDPRSTAEDTRKWVRGRPFTPNLPPDLEAKLIRSTTVGA
jgi:2'-hydroxyisoflavone reductase